MKIIKFFLLSILIQLYFIGNTQVVDHLKVATEYLKAHKTEYSLSDEDISGYLVSSMRTSKLGVTYIYLNQTAYDIEIRNAMMVVVLNKKGEVKALTSDFIPNAKGLVVDKESRIKASEAVTTSAEQLGYKVHSLKPIADRSTNTVSYFKAENFTDSPIKVQNKYELKDGKLVLVWNLQLDMKDNADHWDYNIDANTGEFVSKVNYTVYCTHHKDNFTRHHCSAEEHLQRMEKKIDENIESIKGQATYRVFKLPAESPNHGNSSLVSDNQFPEVSPYGWHDIDGVDGPEYTITRGNNVYAYEDKDDDNLTDGNDTDGGAGLNFDFPLDFKEDPRASNKAAVTNLFYMVNMMHDVTALLGFDEAAGNFQETNYSGVFGGDDQVHAEAFDGITLYETNKDLVNGSHTKINNANFSTPPDGINGRMQMYLWTNDSGAISIDSPDEIKGFVKEYGAARFGNPYPKSTEPPITGECIITMDGSTYPTECCNTILNPENVNGKIAILDRGLCNFSRKVYRAEQAGAIAAVICNVVGVDGGNGEEVLDMSGGLDADKVNIPSVFFKKSQCDAIKLILNNGGKVTMTFQERDNEKADYFDGALDNGIIAHEFGHGISTRLTGGSGNSTCLGNDEQMGEGWSDFFTLIMTREPNDLGTDARGIGTFAAGQEVVGKGIRRFPYSTDMAINGQTYDDIKGTSAPHPLGEIWASILWDIYWKFIDMYGYDPDWRNTESGNYKAVFLVMEGMAMQNCNPGFIYGREAILKADNLHYDGQHFCTLYEIFARRGVGYNAIQGLTSNRNDNFENFETYPQCIEALKVSKTLDHPTGKAGDIVKVQVKATNHTKDNNDKDIIIQDVLPEGLSYVANSGEVSPNINGKTLEFNIGKLLYDSSFTFTYELKTDPSYKSSSVSLDDFESDLAWELEARVGNEYWYPNTDIYRSPSNSISIFNLTLEMDSRIISKDFNITSPQDNVNKIPVLRFWHRYNIEQINDGGFVEISVDGGEFLPVKPEQFIRNGYTGQFAYGTLAIPGLYAFSGKSGEEWVDSYIDLTPYIGKTIKIAFRFGSNTTIAPQDDFPGWYIDDFEIFNMVKYDTGLCIEAEGKPETKKCGAQSSYYIEPEKSTAVHDDNDIFKVAVFPNPVRDLLNISVAAPFTTESKIDLLSVTGKSVFSSVITVSPTNRNFGINTNGLDKGMYILKIQTGKFITSKKVVVH
ncbi:MAG: M36 family metallopeptidase [Saprospiraceae bacterium]